MIVQEQLEGLGFINDGTTKSPFTGKLNKYHLHKDNGHVIKGHDTTDIYLELEGPFITIVLKQQSSWLSSKEQVFKGRCVDIEFLKTILKSCC